jgi:hypothetical protein
MFEFKLNDKTIPLNWGTWSMKRFCDIKGITIAQYFDIIGNGNIDLADVIVILQAAAEHGSKGTVKFSEFEVCEWIDQDGGIVNPEGQIKAFFEWIANSHIVNASNGEKKSQAEANS